MRVYALLSRVKAMLRLTLAIFVWLNDRYTVCTFSYVIVIMLFYLFPNNNIMSCASLRGPWTQRNPRCGVLVDRTNTSIGLIDQSICSTRTGARGRRSGPARGIRPDHWSMISGPPASLIYHWCHLCKHTTLHKTATHICTHMCTH